MLNYNTLRRMLLGLVLCLSASLSFNSHASIALSGDFIASQSCPAYHSIRRQSNPNNLMTQSGQRYTLKAKNKVDPTHYLIEIGREHGLDTPQQRWVAIQCGRVNNASAGTATPTRPRQPSYQYVLATNWQPTFCENHRNKRECQSQHANRYDAQHLSLHGLWPQPRDNAYCGVNAALRTMDRRSAWHLLPDNNLNPALQRSLAQVMPGAASHLDRHQWIKHGTCYGSDVNTYFQDSVHLMQQLNRSAVRDLLVSHLGTEVAVANIRRAFEQAFGAGAGERVKISCKGRRLASLRINLQGKITSDTTLGELIRAAPPAASSNCRRGIVDRAGF